MRTTLKVTIFSTVDRIRSVSFTSLFLFSPDFFERERERKNERERERKNERERKRKNEREREKVKKCARFAFESSLISLFLLIYLGV